MLLPDFMPNAISYLLEERERGLTEELPLSLRCSERPIAIACFRFFTTGPEEEPEWRAPCENSFMTPAMSLGISPTSVHLAQRRREIRAAHERGVGGVLGGGERSEEHTSELQSRSDLVCRLL